MARIGLLGGSFNPAHQGHRAISLHAIKALGLDEVWWLVSPGNPLKEGAKDMAPFEARLASARRMARRAPIRVSDFEAREGTRFTIDTVKRLLCDCSLVLVAEDEKGNPLDVGRKQRTLSTSLRRALHARDRHCTFPGCHRKRYLDGHHLKHWINGGETNPSNITLLCTYHHRLHHEGGFSVAKEADGTLRFITADGRTIPRAGYRLDDFVDDGVGGDDQEPSAEGFRTAAVQRGFERDEVREARGIYRFRRAPAT